MDIIYFDDKRHALLDRFIRNSIGSDVYEEYESKYRSFSIAVKVKSGFRYYVMFYDYYKNENNCLYCVSIKRFSSRSISCSFEVGGKESKKIFEKDVCDFIFEKINERIEFERLTLDIEDVSEYDVYADNTVFRKLNGWI